MTNTHANLPPYKEFASTEAKLLVFSCMLAQAFGNGLTSIYGVFVNPIAAEFGADMSTMSIGMVLYLFTSAMCGALLGTILKPGNVKPFMLSGTVLLALGFIALSQTSSLLAIALSIVLISAAIALYAMMPGNILIADRFNTFRGRALAFSAMGISVGGFILPPVAAELIDLFGWRIAITSIGLVASVLLFACFYFFINDKPSDTVSLKNTEPSETELLDTKSLISNAGFWWITLIFGLFYSCSLIMAVHNIPFFLTLGLTTAEAAWIMALGSVAGVFGKVVYGALVDWFPKHLLLILLSLQLLPCGLWYLQGTITEYSSLIYPVVITIMFFTGGTLPMQPYINSRVFGAATVSKTTGFQSVLSLPIILVAAPIAGAVFDRTGNYQWVYYSCGVVMVFSAMGTLLLKNQNRDL